MYEYVSWKNIRCQSFITWPGWKNPRRCDLQLPNRLHFTSTSSNSTRHVPFAKLPIISVLVHTWPGSISWSWKSYMTCKYKKTHLKPVWKENLHVFILRFNPRCTGAWDRPGHIVLPTTDLLSLFLINHKSIRELPSFFALYMYFITNVKKLPIQLQTNHGWYRVLIFITKRDNQGFVLYYEGSTHMQLWSCKLK